MDVAVFENEADGEVLESFLKAKGFEARSYDDKFLRYFLFLRPPQITYRVQLRKHQFRRASEALDANPPAILGKAIHCPSCGSLHVNYPQMTRKFITPTVLLHVGIIFRIIGHECYCDGCHFTWNLPEPGVVAGREPRVVRQFPF